MVDQTIQQTGYSQRPMNARAQTFNRYLDSISINCTSSTWLNPTFTLESWTIVSLWKYNWKQAWWKIYFPVEWTYIIDIAIHEWVWNTATELFIGVAYNSATILWVSSIANSLNPFLWGSWVTTINALRWEYIEVTWWTDAAWWIILLDITVTKIS